MKKLLILLLPLLLTGCSVTYNIDIYNNEMNINGELVEMDSSKWNSVVIEEVGGEDTSYQDPEYCSDGSCSDTDGVNETTKITFLELVNLRTTDSEYKLDGLSKINDSDKLGIKLQKQYKLSNYKDLITSPGPKNCYKNFSIVKDLENDGIIISTSTKNLCFEQYSNLDEIKIVLKTNYKVESNNADQVDKNTYTWVIDKSNYEDKSIQINLSGEVIKNSNNLLIIIVASCILLGVGIIFLFIKLKDKNANKI